MNHGHSGGHRIAFFGGSFDPPHLGHLAIARAAREALHLESVLFAPVGAQPLKPLGATAPFADRVAMTQLAIQGEEGFVVSLVDAPRGEGRPNYTLDTLRKLHAELPGTAELYCLMGADSFASLARWRRGAEVPFVASLIVASRPGQRLDDLASMLGDGMTLEPHMPAEAENSVDLRSYVVRNAAGESNTFYVLPGLDVEISASAIREQARADCGGRGVQQLVPPPVAKYIREHRLYC